jgi:hypothetical protein
MSRNPDQRVGSSVRVHLREKLFGCSPAGRGAAINSEGSDVERGQESKTM